MTRDEAIAKARKHSSTVPFSEWIVSILTEFEVIKIDEPVSVERALVQIGVKVNDGINGYVGTLTKNSAADVISAIQRAGYTITKT